MRRMRVWRGGLALLACAVSGCGAAARLPTPTATARLVASPTPSPAPQPSATARGGGHPKGTPVTTPITLYSQQRIRAGEYQLINNATEQYVSVTAGAVRTFCPGTGLAGCTDYVTIATTVYSGNVETAVSPRQFVLATAGGVRYAPAKPRQASRVVPSTNLLPVTVLQPDDDGDFASGALVFVVPVGAARFSLRWQTLHVATFTITGTKRKRLVETR